MCPIFPEPSGQKAAAAIVHRPCPSVSTELDRVFAVRFDAPQIHGRSYSELPNKLIPGAGCSELIPETKQDWSTVFYSGEMEVRNNELLLETRGVGRGSFRNFCFMDDSVLSCCLNFPKINWSYFNSDFFISVFYPNV